MPKIVQDKSSGYYVQNKIDIDNRKPRQQTTGNMKGTRSNKPRGFSRVYSTFYKLVQ